MRVGIVAGAVKRDLRGYLLTGGIVLAAVVVALLLHARYTSRPWTRDAQVRANVVGIAPRVTGPVVRIAVRDNQAVAKGDLLFEIDPAIFQARLDEANAALTRTGREWKRQTEFFETSVTDERANVNGQDNLASAKSQLASARVAAEGAKLDLGYTKIVAPVNGYITNLMTSPGTYVRAGQELMALVDRDSFWVAAYFKETQLAHITEGRAAEITLMGHEASPFSGEIDSVGWGVHRADGAAADDLLPTVSQTLDWVRLPQRFPVRVRITGEPPVPLRIGQTASVVAGE